MKCKKCKREVDWVHPETKLCLDCLDEEESRAIEEGMG